MNIQSQAEFPLEERSDNPDDAPVEHIDRYAHALATAEKQIQELQDRNQKLQKDLDHANDEINRLNIILSEVEHQ